MLGRRLRRRRSPLLNSRAPVCADVLESCRRKLCAARPPETYQSRSRTGQAAGSTALSAALRQTAPSTHPVAVEPERGHSSAVIIPFRAGQDERRPLLELTGLARRFSIRKRVGHQERWLRALDGVSLQIGRGEILGVVGRIRLRQVDARQDHRRIHSRRAGSIRFEGNENGELTTRAGALSRVAVWLPGPGRFPSIRTGRSDSDRGNRWSSTPRCRAPKRKRRVTRRSTQSAAAGAARLIPEISGGQQASVGLARVSELRTSLIILESPHRPRRIGPAHGASLFCGAEQDPPLAYMFIARSLRLFFFPRMLSDRSP